MAGGNLVARCGYQLLTHVFIRTNGYASICKVSSYKIHIATAEAVMLRKVGLAQAFCYMVSAAVVSWWKIFMNVGNRQFDDCLLCGNKIFEADPKSSDRSENVIPNSSAE